MKKFFLLAFVAFSGCAVKVESITVAPISSTIDVGEKVYLSATVLPENADVKSFVWSSDKPTVATVDATTGAVTAISEGMATITATTNDGGHTAMSTVTVKVPIDVLGQIPDAIFLKYCKEQMEEWDTDSNGRLSIQEAAAVTTINVRNRWLSSLKGIEYFTGLNKLDCSSNGIDSLDLSTNTTLTILYCDNNRLRSLDVSANTALIELSCRANQIKSIDMSTNTALTRFSCRDNGLTALDMSGCPVLTNLDCDLNELTMLDLSSNPALTTLTCCYNRLTSLDVSVNKALTRLFCEDNPGNGESFPVTAWFDNASVPFGMAPSEQEYHFAREWDAGLGRTVQIDYIKAN